MKYDLIAFDADDTLWHSETIFSMTQEKYKALLANYHSPNWIEKKLYETEMRNLAYFGYGIKGFTLSMIETAIELTEGRIKGGEINQIIQFAKEMLQAPVQLLEHVEEVIHRLAGEYELMIITKGDLFDQQTKIAQSGVADYFGRIEVVSNKKSATYAKLLVRHRIDPQNFLMVGNSLRSDVLPVLEAGGQAVHIPYHITWTHETVSEEQAARADYTRLEHIGQLPAWLEKK